MFISRSCGILYDHLRDALATERFAALESLTLESSKRVENGCQEQEDCRSDQATRTSRQTRPLHCAHDGVNGCAHVICLELADEGVEFGRRRADAEEEGYLDEYDDEGAYSVRG